MPSRSPARLPVPGPPLRTLAKGMSLLPYGVLASIQPDPFSGGGRSSHTRLAFFAELGASSDSAGEKGGSKALSKKGISIGLVRDHRLSHATTKIASRRPPWGSRVFATLAFLRLCYACFEDVLMPPWVADWPRFPPVSPATCDPCFLFTASFR